VDEGGAVSLALEEGGKITYAEVYTALGEKPLLVVGEKIRVKESNLDAKRPPYGG